MTTVTILFQNKAHDFFKGRLDLSGINYKKNVGHVIEMLLRKVGLDWSSSGRLLWWTSRGREASSLAWKQPARAGSRKPAEARPSTIGDLDDEELEASTTRQRPVLARERLNGRRRRRGQSRRACWSACDQSALTGSSEARAGGTCLAR